MNKLLFTITLLTISFIGIAQKKAKAFKAEFELSEEMKGQKGLGFVTLGSDGSNTFTMSTKGAIVNGIPMGFKYVLNKFDGKMTHILSENVPMRTSAYKIGYYTGIDISMIGNRIIQTVAGFDKKTSKQNFYVVEYSTSSLKPKGRKLLGSFKSSKKRKAKVKNIATTFSDPENSNEFAVVVQSSKSSSKSISTVYIVDEGLNISLKTEFGIEGSYEQTRFVNYIIKDDYVAFVCIVMGKKDNPDKANFYIVDRKTEEVNTFEISLQDIGNDISDFQCAVHENGRLHVTGFYKAAGEKVDDTGGAFTQIYDIKEGSILSQDIHPFTFDFVTENMSERKKTKAKKRSDKGKDIDAYEYLVREVITNADGSSTLVAERYRYYVTTSTDSKGRTVYTDHYIHADLITMRTSKEGEIEWVERFKKFNHSTNPAQGHFLFRDAGDYFYIVYYEEDALKIAQINKEDGKGKAKELYTKREIGSYIISVGSAVQVNENKYISVFSRLKKARLLTMEFNDK